MTQKPQPPEADRSEGPDWSAIGHDVICPLCGYNLRGLNTPRCPECGFGFAWPEVLDPNRRKHAYLFEHHPERNVRSRVRTMIGTWRPKRFWMSLHPGQPSHPKRLLIYWFIGAFLYIAAVTAVPIVQVAGNAWENRQARQRLIEQFKNPATPWEMQMANSIIQQFGTIEAWAQTVLPAMPWWQFIRYHLSVREFEAVAVMMVIPLGWAWVTIAALMIFRVSMGRARVKPIHVRRCVLYSHDLLGWFGLGFLLLTIGRAVWRGANSGIVRSGVTWIGPIPRLWLDPEEHLMLLVYPLLAAILICSHRLWRSYRHYLRFDRPLATVLAAQLITSLFMLNVYVLLTV